jgi:hypothetical protein
MREPGIGSKTKLPYFISDESTQQGDSFGDKLSHAIQSVLDRGYDKVIVLGNDSRIAFESSTGSFSGITR